MQLYPDGSLRPVPRRTRTEGEHRQTIADFYGDLPLPSTGNGVRSIQSLLAEVDLGVEEEDFTQELLQKAWTDAVGDFLATQAQLVALSRGTALIRTSHPAVRFELQRQRGRLINSLNQTLGEGAVQKVRITHS